jgi:hypothetical protein
MKEIRGGNEIIFKNIVSKLSDDIFKEVLSYILPCNIEYIFKNCGSSHIVKILNYTKNNSDITYAINKLKNKIQKEAYILRVLIDNNLPTAEKNYDNILKNTLKEIIKNIFSKTLYITDKKINEIISVYVRNIDIIDVNKNNQKRFKIIWVLNKIRNLFFC